MKKLIVLIIVAICTFQVGFSQEIDQVTLTKIKVKLKSAENLYKDGKYFEVIRKIEEIEKITGGMRSAKIQNLKVKTYVAREMYSSAERELNKLYKMNPDDEIIQDIASYEARLNSGLEEMKKIAENEKKLKLLVKKINQAFEPKNLANDFEKEIVKKLEKHIEKLDEYIIKRVNSKTGCVLGDCESGFSIYIWNVTDSKNIGSIYIGDYVPDKKTTGSFKSGLGIYAWFSSSSLYIGEWKSEGSWGERSGFGMHINGTTGEIQLGYFKNGKYLGRNKY